MPPPVVNDLGVIQVDAVENFRKVGPVTQSSGEHGPLEPKPVQDASHSLSLINHGIEVKPVLLARSASPFEFNFLDSGYRLNNLLGYDE